jgi:hypothetical protein
MKRLTLKEIQETKKVIQQVETIKGGVICGEVTRLEFA